MDATENTGDQTRERVMELAKRVSQIWNANVSVKPPTGVAPNSAWILEVNGVGRIQFDPTAKVSDFPEIIRPPVKRNRKTGNGAASGEQPAKRGKRVSS